MRRARTAALQRMAAAADCGWVLLGHQRDDQAETVLLNLLRGAGLRGLAGMPIRRGIFVRPLLETPRDLLRRYMESIGASWVDDPTNIDPGPLRNRIRNRVLPLLEREIQPRAAEAIARASRHLQRALAALDAQVALCLRSSSLPSGKDEIRLDPAQLRSYHQGLTELALRQAVAQIRGTTSEISASTWIEMAEACRAGRQGLFPLPGHAVVEVTDRFVRIGRGAQESHVPEAVPVPLSGEVPWGTGRLIARIVASQVAPRLRVRGLERLQVFDASALRHPIRLRPPVDGDRVAIEDGAGSRKVSDLLSERGVPRALRGRQPILEDEAGILWVPGIRRAARGLVGARTEKIWIVRWLGHLPSDRALMGGESRG